MNTEHRKRNVHLDVRLMSEASELQMRSYNPTAVTPLSAVDIASICPHPAQFVVIFFTCKLEDDETL